MSFKQISKIYLAHVYPERQYYDLIFPSKRAIRESGDRSTQNKRNILSGLLCLKASLKGPFRNLRIDISGSAPALTPASAFKYKQCFYHNINILQNQNLLQYTFVKRAIFSRVATYRLEACNIVRKGMGKISSIFGKITDSTLQGNKFIYTLVCLRHFSQNVPFKTVSFQNIFENMWWCFQQSSGVCTEGLQLY